MMDLLKKHVDTVIILGAFASAFLWMNASINEVKKEIAGIQKEVSEIQKEIAIIKTVLLMKNILPAELAQKEDGK